MIGKNKKFKNSNSQISEIINVTSTLHADNKSNRIYKLRLCQNICKYSKNKPNTY